MNGGTSIIPNVLQFRLETFNLFNKAQFFGPAATWIARCLAKWLTRRRRDSCNWRSNIHSNYGAVGFCKFARKSSELIV